MLHATAHSSPRQTMAQDDTLVSPPFPGSLGPQRSISPQGAPVSQARVAMEGKPFPHGLVKPPDTCPQALRSFTAIECEALCCLEAPADAFVLTFRGCHQEADPAEQPAKSKAQGLSYLVRIKSHPNGTCMIYRANSVMHSHFLNHFNTSLFLGLCEIPGASQSNRRSQPCPG